MRKTQFLTVFWTLLVAVPLTALSLSLAAYLTDHLVEIATAISNFGLLATVNGRGWALEFSARWPEVAGMIVGQVVILIILILVRREKATEANNHK